MANQSPAANEERATIGRELQARGVQSALWISLLLAQEAGFDDLVDGIIVLHSIACDRRYEIEEAAA